MSRTHRFTLGLGLVSAGILAVLWAHTDLTHDEQVVLLGSIAPLVYLQLRGIEVRALPRSANEPAVTVTWSLIEAVVVPIAAVVAPAAAATLVAGSGLVATVLRRRRRRPFLDTAALLAGSMSATALNVIAVGVLMHALLDSRSGAAVEVFAVASGVVLLQLLGLGWDLALYAVSRRPLSLHLELETVHLVPLMAVLGSILLLSYDGHNLGGAVTALVLGLLLAESLRRFYSRALELRRQNENREHLLRTVLDTEDARRADLASRLHDGAVQTVTSSKLRLETLVDGDLALAGPDARAQLRAVADALDVACHELRELMRDDVRLPRMDEPLLTALERERTAYSGSFPGGLTLDYDVRRSLDPDTELLTFQLVHEALVNVRRHADASKVRVAVRETASGGLLVEITDNGRGFDAQAAESARAAGHFGLLTLQERAEARGGTFSVESAREGGTMVRGVLPCDT
jgi:signal transduction histidine kinase